MMMLGFENRQNNYEQIGWKICLQIDPGHIKSTIYDRLPINVKRFFIKTLRLFIERDGHNFEHLLKPFYLYVVSIFFSMNVKTLLN